MLDDLFNSTALTAIIAIAAASAVLTGHPTRPREAAELPMQSVQAAPVAGDTPDVLTMVYGADAGVTITDLTAMETRQVVQMPPVMVIGHREQPVERTSVAVVDTDAE